MVRQDAQYIPDHTCKGKRMLFQAMILHCKAILGWDNMGYEVNFVMNHDPGAGLIA